MIGWRSDVPAVPALGNFAGLDPYVLWAVATGWRFQWQVQAASPRQYVGRMPPYVTVLARTRKGLAKGSAGEALQPLRELGWKVPSVYDRMPMEEGRPVWFTARVPDGQMVTMLAGPHACLVWELAVPQRDAETTARANPLGLYGERDRSAYGPADRSFDEAVGRRATRSAMTDRPDRLRSALAVVDFGGAFLHTQFRNHSGTKTRLRALWDQGSDVGGLKSWKEPAQMGYGREIRHPAIDTLLERLLSHQADETDVYRQLDHLIDYDDARRRIWVATHGTHVLHVAGGLDDALAAGEDSSRPPPASPENLLFVQVPSLTASDCSGASMGAHLLDALHYVLSQCEESARVVVNLSHGTYAGPHDGSSMIEQALDDLLRARPRLAVVLAAGNARQRQGHTRRVIRRDQSARLRVELVPGDSTPTFVEIWHTARSTSDRERRARPQALLQLRVRSAAGDWSDWVGHGQAQFLCDVSSWPLVMVRNQHSVPSDDMDLMLVAFAPTMRPADDDGPLVQAGVWEIEVRLPGKAVGLEQVTIDAYVERDDPGDFSDGAQPGFLGVDARDAEESLSSLCSGPNVIVVGGFRRQDGMQTSYSSVGKTEGHKIMGACEESRWCPGIRAAAVRSGETFLMNGTSVAAPVVARRLYEWMVNAEDGVFDKEGRWRRAALDAIVTHEHGSEGHDAVKHWPD